MEQSKHHPQGGNRAALGPLAARSRGDWWCEDEISPVLKALRLLAFIAHSGEPVALSEMTRALGLPKPTSHRLAGMLERARFVQKDPLTSRYSVGAKLEDVALVALRNGARAHTRRFLMQDLAERAGARVNFAILKSGKPMLVEWVESVSVIRVDLTAETPVPAHCSASGKLLMAFAPEAIRERFLKSAPFKALTKSTITSAKGLEREFEVIRRRGYSEDNQEFLPGVCCLAVPVRNGAGDAVAGLALMAPAIGVSLAKARRCLPDLRACADAISAEYGWHLPHARSRTRTPARRQR
jgi:IclR family transcriptional regulator, acetate operon repressor